MFCAEQDMARVQGDESTVLNPSKWYVGAKTKRWSTEGLPTQALVKGYGVSEPRKRKDRFSRSPYKGEEVEKEEEE